jgi:hypothetical protein
VFHHQNKPDPESTTPEITKNSLWEKGLVVAAETIQYITTKRKKTTKKFCALGKKKAGTKRKRV